MTRRMYVSVAFAAVALSCQAVVWGAANAQALFEQGMNAQNGHNQAIDLPGGQALLEKAAAAGSARAMHRLGDMYHDGDGGAAKDNAKALEWYRKEAELDQSQPGTGALGMLALGDAYAMGQGVTKDQAQSMEWYKKAVASAQIGANKGELTAILALANCLMDGKGVKANPVQAWTWALKSLDTPNPWSHELMATMYMRGVGVEKNPEKALQYLLKAAQSGVTQDMVDASLCFANGIGVKADQKAAFDWAQKAMERGSCRAMAILGRYYNLGAGVQRSDAQAKEWYQKAIDKGDEAAMGFMGDQFIMPGVSPRNAEEAMRWYQQGAERGDTNSMYQLAMVLTKDPDTKHTAEDVSRAAAMLRQAAELNSADAMNALGEMYRATKPPFLPGTPAERRAAAMDWFKKAAEAGLPAGMRNYGELRYEEGSGGNLRNRNGDNPKLMAEGLQWITAAANAGDAEAMADLGDAFQFGEGVPQSMFTAATWYKKAGDAGNVRAMRSLGVLFADGRSLGTDYQSAYKWLKKAADLNDARSIAGLGELYELGVGIPSATPVPNGGSISIAAKPDYAMAWRLYQQAFNMDEAAGFRGLGHLFQEGLGVDRDLAQAAKYYAQAVDRNDQRAMEALGWMYELGQGVPKDSKKSRALFQQSADMFNSPTAQSWLVSHDPESVIKATPATRAAP